MAYKKYIEKNGKIYGPYVYHSKRIGDKVISEYHGIKTEKKTYKKKLIVTIGTILFLFLIFWIIFFSIQFSGKVILNVEENHQQGKINIKLNQGELLPYNSKLILENAENFYEFNLYELIKTNSVEGEYFVDGIDLNGQGKGYGTKGQKEIIPTIFFELNITSEETTPEIAEETPQLNEPIEETTPEIAEETSTQNIPEETPQLNEPLEETTPEIAEETSTQNIPETTTPEATEANPSPITGKIIGGIISSISKSFRGILTGNVIQEEIQGDVSKGNPIEYSIPKNSKVEIISGSVKTEEKKLSENVLNLKIENNKVIISTNYSEINEGFGEEYLGEEITTFSIELNNLNIPLEEGDTTIKIIYQDIEIYSIKHTISSEELIEEPTESTENPIQNITNETQLTINETTTLEEINITEENITIDLTFEQINLTKEEKELIKNTVSFPLVQTKVNRYKDKFEVIFTLGEYELEHYYNSNLNEENLKNQIERDRIIWLKDLANKFSEKIILTERREDLDENYAIM